LKKKLLIFAIITVLILGIATYIHYDIYSVPKSRLALNETYPEMPADSLHHYIDFQLDYQNDSSAKFRGFYLLSPNFSKNKPITFLLTDGQMELVNTQTDFTFFEEILGASSYVLIGARGHAPTFLPEVYTDDKIDYRKALTYYNSDQHVEDIERVRLDLIKKGILGDDEKINIFGASGAGVLAQQYISKYGAHVKRVILESTGAPDLAQKNGLQYSPNFSHYHKEADSLLAVYLKEQPSEKAFVSNVLYQQGRSEAHPKEVQLKTLENLKNNGWLLKYKVKPITNLSLFDYLLKAPKSISARIRWFELVGNDLLQYEHQNEINLLYEISSVTLSDILEYHKKHKIKPKEFNINRDFFGEVLIIKGREDVVFGDEISLLLKNAYPNSKVLFFEDGHRMQKDKSTYRKIRTHFLSKGFKSLN